MNQKGFVNLIVIGIVVVVLGVVGYFGLKSMTPIETKHPAPLPNVSIKTTFPPSGLQPLTAAEIQQAVTVLKSDNRVRTSLATSQRVRTISVARHEEDKYAPTGLRRADVVLYNYDKNEVISAVVILGSNPRVDHLTVTMGQEPMSTKGVEEAKKLALADPNVQAQLRIAGFAGRENELIITNIRFQSAVPDDPCSIHLCIELTFNTPDAVIDIRPVVDLTTREVKIKRR